MKQSDDNRNTIDDTPLNGPVFCVTQLSEGWYLFGKGNVKHLEGRINDQIFGFKGFSGANPAMEDGEVDRKVCFTQKRIGCCYRSD